MSGYLRNVFYLTKDTTLSKIKQDPKYPFKLLMKTCMLLGAVTLYSKYKEQNTLVVQAEEDCMQMLAGKIDQLDKNEDS